MNTEKFTPFRVFYPYTLSTGHGLSRMIAVECVRLGSKCSLARPRPIITRSAP